MQKFVLVLHKLALTRKNTMERKKMARIRDKPEKFRMVM
jgi:hypothetical protein